jgi:hypothetical protein
VAALLAVHTAVYELEAAPPAPPLLKDDFARLYRVVGAAALVVRG